MSIDEPTFTYAQESKQPEPPTTMIVCNHCGHIARDGFAMDVHWDTYQHHKSHGAHPLGSDPKDMDRLRDQQRDLLKKMGLTVAGEHAATQAALISEAKAHQWEHKLGNASGPVDAAKIFAGAREAVRRTDAEFHALRRFTREEVLTVIKARKASQAPCPGLADVFSALDHLILVFERME